jgi:hypothetical protein
MLSDKDFEIWQSVNDQANVYAHFPSRQYKLQMFAWIYVLP